MSDATRRALQGFSWLACVITIVPSLLYLGGVMTLDAMKWSMFAATLAWFAVTPLWMGRAR